jgi:hypothetical protein
MSEPCIHPPYDDAYWWWEADDDDPVWDEYNDPELADQPYKPGEEPTEDDDRWADEDFVQPMPVAAAIRADSPDAFLESSYEDIYDAHPEWFD